VVPVKMLKNPPVNDKPPEGYINVKSYEFEHETDRPPTSELETMEVWGVNHISRKNGGMWDENGNPVPAHW